MSRNAGSGENGDFGEILSVNLTIFMQITLTEMDLTCWPIWQIWRFLCKLHVDEFGEFGDFYASYITGDRSNLLADLADLANLAIFMQITWG